MNVASQIKPLLTDAYEVIISDYQDLYNRNYRVNKSNLYSLIQEFQALKNGQLPFPTTSKESQLNNLNTKVRGLITDQKTVVDFQLISRKYLEQKAVDEFNAKNPLRETNNEFSALLRDMTRAQRIEKECAVSEETVFKEKINHKMSVLVKLYKCLNDYGLREDIIHKRGEELDLYNIFVTYINSKAKEKKDALILISKDELEEQFVEPYNSKHSIMFDGVEIKSENVRAIKISVGKFKKKEVVLHVRKKGYTFDENQSQSRIRYFNLCKNVTGEFINTKKSIQVKSHGEYVFPNRLTELKSISSTEFNLKKLIQLCEELNIANKNNLLFTKAALVRAICDHVPTIFGFESFDEVASNHRADGNTRSFKGAVKKLHEFFKHVADGVMHSHARKKESLPTHEQLDVSRELDFLLQEVCRLLKD
ncbi:MAG TPA: hypothetical protein VNZ49_11885 [Bacteroidia bacterium]|jgi:hypothetical protein|nr:hypothetical protein [Bacteroidia bacterium]